MRTIKTDEGGKKMDRNTETFRRTVENSLNGINPADLTPEELEIQAQWVEDNWDDLNEASHD